MIGFRYDPKMFASRAREISFLVLPLAALVVTGCDASLERGATRGGAEALAVSPEPEPAPEPRPQPLDESPRAITRGLDGEMLATAVQNAGELPRLYGVIVGRHGEIVLERHFRGPALDQPTNVKSASKSLISAVAGLALEEGILGDLDQPIAPFFPEYVDGDMDPRKEEITVRDLLAMRSGLETTSSRNYGRWVSSSDWVGFALNQPMVAEPGTQMIYSTGNSHVLSALITEAAGRSTHAYARERLAEPLGIRLPPWPTDPKGIYFGGNDMLISARDLFRFGEMYRNGGTLDGREILSREWIEESWRVRLRRSRRRGDDYYGLGWWGRDSNGYAVRFAWGYGGQFLFIVPALELTVVFTSDPWSPREGPHNSRLHAILDDLIIPAAMVGSNDATPPSEGRSGPDAGPSPRSPSAER